MVTTFQKHLAKTNLAKNTITSYLWTVDYFLNHYKEVNKKNLLAYKGYLVENFKPQTVNLRLQAINKYLEFTKQEKLKVKFVKVQQKNFLENVISDADYKFLKTKLKTDGYDDIFLNRFGQRITTRGIAQQLKHFAEKYGLNRDVVYPHSFRHRFAKNFLDRFNDLALLADLMGHESIETTRIYLRRTASEQQKIVDRVVNW